MGKIEALQFLERVPQMTLRRFGLLPPTVSLKQNISLIRVFAAEEADGGEESGAEEEEAAGFRDGGRRRRRDGADIEDRIMIVEAHVAIPGEDDLVSHQPEADAAVIEVIEDFGDAPERGIGEGHHERRNRVAVFVLSDLELVVGEVGGVQVSACLGAKVQLSGPNGDRRSGVVLVARRDETIKRVEVVECFRGIREVEGAFDLATVESCKEGQGDEGERENENESDWDFHGASPQRCWMVVKG